MSDSAPVPSIKIRKNGPLLVTGDVLLTDHDGNVIEPPKRPFALCRCGASDSKPYCDGTHNRIGFCATPDEAPAEG